MTARHRTADSRAPAAARRSDSLVAVSVSTRPCGQDQQPLHSGRRTAAPLPLRASGRRQWRHPGLASQGDGVGHHAVQKRRVQARLGDHIHTAPQQFRASIRRPLSASALVPGARVTSRSVSLLSPPSPRLIEPSTHTPGTPRRCARASSSAWRCSISGCRPVSAAGRTTATNDPHALRAVSRSSDQPTPPAPVARPTPATPSTTPPASTDPAAPAAAVPPATAGSAPAGTRAGPTSA